MSKQNDVQCEHLMSNLFCDALVSEEGKRVREESCSNELKNLCCYLCNVKEVCEISCAFLDRTPTEVANVVVMEEGERTLESWEGQVEKVAKVIARRGGYSVRELGLSEVKEIEYGTLLLTSRRLIWVARRGSSRSLEFEIPLETIQDVSSGEKEASVTDRRMEHRFHFNRVTDEEFSDFVKRQVQRRQKEIGGATVEFSFVKDYMMKGGLTLQTVKCPECGGRLKLPETGKQTTCEHCGKAVYAQDILQRIKDLIG